MKILIIGASGLLGKAVTEELKDYEIFTPTSNELDITKREKVEKYVLEKLPNIIINCAAYTNVDKAEEEKEYAYNINCIGTLNLAQICNNYNITLIHISTDYVFDGKKAQYYSYKEDDELYLNPTTMYGITKLQGEKKIINFCEKYYILRTSWLFGDGKNFIRTIISLSKENSEINVVNDQFGNPTYTVDLAQSKIYVFKINGIKYELQNEIKLNEQEQPRHLICYKRNIYILCENTSKIISLKYEDGQFIQTQEIATLNSKEKILNMPSAIRRYKKYIFVSNRGENTISIFRIHKYGTLQRAGYFRTKGENPRDFNILNNGKILVVANQNSNEVLTFKINYKKNEVINIDKIQIEQPVCVEK